MPVRIFDLAHNRDGFETATINQIMDILVHVHGIPTDVQVIHLATGSQKVGEVLPDTNVVVIVCHGEPNLDSVIHASGPTTTFFTGDFYLDTEISGDDLPEDASDEERHGLAMALRDPNMLPHYLDLPKTPFAVVWYVCNSATADAPLFGVPSCRASVSFAGPAWAADYYVVAEAVALLHRHLPDENHGFEELEQLKKDLADRNACMVFRRGMKLVLLPPQEENPE